MRGPENQPRRSGKHATGVSYVDCSGAEWEQPGEIVLVCAFAFNNVQMLLHSGIGQPYDSSTRQGTIGRNYAYQTTSGLELFFDDKIFNPFISSGALAQVVDDFNGDTFDHSKLGFVGGAGINTGPTNGRPIQTRPTPAGTPRWGAKWKQATKVLSAQLWLQLAGLELRGLRQPSRSRSHLQGPFWTAAYADDLRFS